METISCHPQTYPCCDDPRAENERDDIVREFAKTHLKNGRFPNSWIEDRLCITLVAKKTVIL
jgi:hypothetical protein